jgi:carboxyl-terminal processing protease
MGAALFAAFGAGYGVRAQNESDWVPSGGDLPALNLVRTADGHLLVDAKPTAGTTSVNARRTYKPNLKPYETLDEVRRAIRDNFVRTKVTDEELTHGAIRGMLRSLGDRFTRFMTPEDYAKFTEQSNAEFVGIGARIDLKDDYMGSADAKPFGASRPYIVEPIAGGPAEKNKLQKDDVILAVDGRSTADMSEDTVVSRIRGVRGTPVKLKIERRTGKAAQLNRDNAYKVFDITLTRDIIEVRPVKLEWLPNRIAWLRVDEFNKKTDAEMGEAMASLRKGPNNQGMAKGLFSTCATIPVVCSMSPWMLALASFRRPHRLHP